MLRAAQALSLIRMAFGFYFVVSVSRKIATGWLTDSQALTEFVNRNLDAATPGYRHFLEAGVLPDADRLAQLVVVGEMVAGVCLLAGFLTRLGALTGMFLVLNFMLAKGLGTFEGSQDRLFFAVCAVFAISPAGLTWGLDGALRRQLAANGLTRWLSSIPPATRATGRPIRVHGGRRRAA